MEKNSKPIKSSPNHNTLYFQCDYFISILQNLFLCLFPLTVLIPKINALFLILVHIMCGMVESLTTFFYPWGTAMPAWNLTTFSCTQELFTATSGKKQWINLGISWMTEIIHLQNMWNVFSVLLSKQLFSIKKSCKICLSSVLLRNCFLLHLFYLLRNVLCFRLVLSSLW